MDTSGVTLYRAPARTASTGLASTAPSLRIFHLEFAATRNYHGRTRERRLIHTQMKNFDCSDIREVAEA